MRKILIAGIMALFAATATVGAPALAQEQEGTNLTGAWHVIAIGVGSLAGIWAVNVASGGLALGTIGASLALGSYSAALWTALTPVHAVLITSGAVSGGYIAAWISD